MPSSKSCSKSVTEFFAVNLISTPLWLFIFKHPKAITVLVKTGSTMPVIFSLWEDLKKLPRSLGFILWNRAASTFKISKFIFFICQQTTPKTSKINKFRRVIHLRTHPIFTGWDIHRKASDHQTSCYFGESFCLQAFQLGRPMAIPRIRKCQSYKYVYLYVYMNINTHRQL